MKFQIDHDYHTHTQLSLCSNHPLQTHENMLKYAEDNGFKELVFTDHFWEHEVYAPEFEFYKIQTLDYIKQRLPLPQSDKVKVYFGGETDLDMNFVPGAGNRAFSELDFVIIPTTHLHMSGFTIKPDATLNDRKELFIERLGRVMDMDLPFFKVGIAHMTCHLMAPLSFNDHLELLSMISDDTYRQMFAPIAKKGAGFELNFDHRKYTADTLPVILRPYKLAKEVGCKFYLGSDTHTPEDSADAMIRFNAMVDLLELTEDDRFRLQ